MGAASDEFPLLSGLGLYAAEIRGDGNCLFNALSDQLYGTQAEHHTIRAAVIQHMRDHADYYKQFIDVYPGGGIRRNPKRKNAGAYSTPSTFHPPSAEDISRVFESHLQSMAKGGTYGDNMEISAFAAAFGWDVKIYQRDFAYMVTSQEQSKGKVAHIAYHTWEHYSSIRNLDGPHTGLPDVHPRALSQEEEQLQKSKLAATPYVLPWMVDVVSSSLPFLADKVVIKRALEESKGNIDAAVSKLLDAEERGSVSSTQESSSVEREPDSDNEASHTPNKKRDRRMSRATKAKQAHYRQLMANFPLSHGGSGSQHSFNSSHSSPPWPPNSQSSLRTEIEDTEDDEAEGRSFHAPSSPPRSVDAEDEDDESASEPALSRKSSISQKPLRIKLIAPLPDDEDTKPPPQLSPAGRSRQRQPGPEIRKPSARERKDMKKMAQKAARKERALAEMGRNSVPAHANGANPNTIAVSASKGAAPAPALESGIKTLYI